MGQKSQNQVREGGLFEHWGKCFEDPLGRPDDRIRERLLGHRRRGPAEGDVPPLGAILLGPLLCQSARELSFSGNLRLSGYYVERWSPVADVHLFRRATASL